MNKFFLKLILLIFIFQLLSFTHSVNNSEKKEIVLLARTFHHFADENADSVWPGFQLNDQPVFFHFNGGYVYAMGLKEKSAIWEERNFDDFSILFCAEFPIPLPVFQTQYPFQNEKVFVFKLDDRQDDFTVLTFIHERFHSFQFTHFQKEKVTKPNIQDYQNPDNLVLIEAENRILTAFIKAGDPEIKSELIKDYFAVNEYRRQSLHPESIKWEDHQQKMEGLADYASLKTFQVYPLIADFCPEDYLLQMRQKKNNGSIYSAKDIIKERHYFVGAALGFALDFCKVDHWKEDVAKANGSLHNLLKKSISIDEQEQSSRLARIETELDFSALQEEIHLQFEIAKKEADKIREDFQEQNGVTIKVTIPPGSMSASGRHNKSMQIDNQRALIEDTSLSCGQDHSWFFSFTNIPLVFEELNGSRTFKIGTDDIIELDGKKMAVKEVLKQNSTADFSTIKLKNDHCELDANRLGTLSIVQGTLLIQFKK